MPNYYLSPTGDDNADGLSVLNPWRTLAHLSAAPIQPGDTVRLAAGGAFLGRIDWTWKGIGDQNRPILVDRYGPEDSPNPVVFSPNDSFGFGYTGPGGVHLRAIKFHGNCIASNEVDGVLFTPENGKPCLNIQLKGTEITGYTRSGVYAFNAGGMVLEDTLLHHNGNGTYLHTIDGLTLRNCRSWENDWAWSFPSNSGNVGQGFSVYSSQNVMVEHSVARRNALKTDFAAGQCGFNFQDCNRVSGAYCIADGNGDKSGLDGQGFCLYGCWDSLLLYCLATDNLHGGFSLFNDAWSRAVQRCVLRHCTGQGNVIDLALVGNVRDSHVLDSHFFTTRRDKYRKAFDVADAAREEGDTRLPDKRSVSVYGCDFNGDGPSDMLVAEPGLAGVEGLAANGWNCAEPSFQVRGQTHATIAAALAAEPVGV